jgi:hypothetical protein
VTIGEGALSTGDPLRHLRVTSVRSKVALSFDARSLAQRRERWAEKTKLVPASAGKIRGNAGIEGDEEGREGSAALSEPSCQREERSPCSTKARLPYVFSRSHEHLLKRALFVEHPFRTASEGTGGAKRTPASSRAALPSRPSSSPADTR